MSHVEGFMLRAATRLLLVAGSAALGAAGAVTLRADLLVSYGVGKALEDREAAPPFELAASGGSLASSLVRVERAEAGDGVHWYTRSSLDLNAPFDRRLAVGDRITIAGRALEIVEIKSAEVPLLRVAASDESPPKLVRVTARAVAPGREAGELVHFYFEIEERKPPAIPDRKAPLGRT
jgi:hypothetical protein